MLGSLEKHLELACSWCSVDDMVVAAVISLQDPVGSGADDICTWIEVSIYSTGGFCFINTDIVPICHISCTGKSILWRQLTLSFLTSQSADHSSTT